MSARRIERAERRVEQWVRPEIRRLSAYHVPSAEGMIKLDAMENPYGWPPEMAAAWLQVIRRTALNRYPDPHATALKKRLRANMRIPDAAGLVLGNGSDELIQMVALLVGGPGRVLLTPEPGFAMYRLIAEVTGTGYRGVDLNAEDFSLDLDTWLSAIEEVRPAVIFIAHPNNPTGNLFSEEALRATVEHAPGLVVVDEAYAPFASHSMLRWLGRYENLLVMRTVSKMGLAGLRLGLLAGPAPWLRELEKVRLPYNVNTLTQVSADFALDRSAVLDDQAARIRAERARLFEAINDNARLHAFPSEANFVLFRTPPGWGGGVFSALLDAGILIKNVGGAHPLLADCLRVTVGTPEENDAFIKALTGAVARESRAGT